FRDAPLTEELLMIEKTANAPGLRRAIDAFATLPGIAKDEVLEACSDLEVSQLAPLIAGATHVWGAGVSKAISRRAAQLAALSGGTLISLAYSIDVATAPELEKALAQVEARPAGAFDRMLH